MRSTVTNLALANIKKDKTRSILIMISICITTLLLTAIALAGYGLIDIQKRNAAEWYGDYYGSYIKVTRENIEEMQRRSEFTDLGILSNYGEVDSAKSLFFLWMDDGAVNMTHMEKSLTEGNYPKKGNEITAQPAFFRQLGIENPQIGDRVEISFRTDRKSVYVSEEFVICGLLKDTELERNSMGAYTSKEHFENHVAQDDRRYNVLFRLDDSVGLTYDNAEIIMKELAVKCGIDEDKVSENVMYLMWELDPGTETIMVCAGVCTIVILFSVVVIYNIFQVGIVQKIQEYGKLKAMGATKKQMKQVVFREGMALACVGVPFGLAAGVLTAKGVLYYLMKDFGDSGLPVKQGGVSMLCIPLLFLAAALAFLTVSFALKKPMRVVAGISPVEAMRYREEGRDAGLRKGKKELGVTGMTLANLSGSRRRTVSTVLSMGLSCVLFVVLANWLGNMDEVYMARNEVLHGQFQIKLDYSMNDEAYPENNLNHILERNPISEELLSKIRKLPEVAEVRTQSILYAKRLDITGKETGETYSILVLDREDFEWQVKNQEIGGLDYDEMSRQDAVCFGWGNYLEDEGFSLGETYHFSLYDGVAEKECDFPMAAAFLYLPDGDMAITRDTYEKLGLTGNVNDYLWVDCREEDRESLKTKLEALLGELEHVEWDSYENQLEIARLSTRTLKMPVYTFCVMIAFISFMNMANTMITGIVTRKQEFGVLQAIGMTNRQLSRSLWLEGTIFTLGTVAVSLLAGIPLGYGLFRYGKLHAFAGLSVYHFPVWETVLLLGGLMVLQMVLSLCLSRNIKKESLVERIRYQG